MKPLARPLFTALLACSLASVLHAHPGHDGDHEFTWDFDHLVAHPGATILCFSVIGAGVYLAYRLAKRSHETTERQ
jgi:hypothetical protein